MLLAPPAPVTGATLEDAEAEQARVEADQAAMLAPTRYLRGTESLQKARDATDPTARQLAADEALAQFRAAARDAATARSALATVIASREAANTAEAWRLAPGDWARAEKLFADAVRSLEGGKGEAAQKRGARAEAVYRAAELDAIKAGHLTAARNALVAADEARADRLAPRSLARARQLLAEAEATLDADRYAGDAAAELAARAEYQARLAARLAAQAQRVRDGDATIEDLLLEAQAAMAGLAETAGTSQDFSAGYADVAAELRAVLQRVPALEAELGQRARQVAGLEDEIRELDQRLGAASAERRDLMRSLEANARVREQFELVGSLFTPAEAEVLRDGDKLILRLVGLRFPSNSARLDDDATALLGRLETAIQVFPRSEVLVEGHTDSSGRPQRNRVLSEERARAVASYLVETTGIPAFRIKPAGYGDSRPIASNRTQEGRAQNRRIDVVIVPQLPPGN